MLFNSIDFAIFLPIVFVLYWFVLNKNLKIQNMFLLLASYLFYGWWDWRFLFLIIVSSFVDFLVGVRLSKQENNTKRKLLLFTSIFVNLGLLGVFKYYNFFVDGFVQAFSLFGKDIDIRSLRIVLPVGISFYTFQTLSYTIDVYKKKLAPTKNIVAFFGYVGFFPQLVAGPIERATRLLPQFCEKRIFQYDQAVDGMRQIVWGLFKKIVIADNCAKYVNDIFANYTDYSGSTLLLGTILFAIQIYCDFSGYSDIAIGTARLFGFHLMRNFAFPYFSRDIAEFWRRWHISLTSWFRDYVYIPLGGSRGGHWMKIRNIFIIFLVSGLWHGANWTFIAWGIINAMYFLPIMLMNKNRRYLNTVAENKLYPNLKETLQMGITFFLTLIAWIFFRAESLHHAIYYLMNMFTLSIFSTPDIFPIKVLLLILIFTIVEWLQRDKQHALEIKNLPMALRWGTYFLLTITIISFFGGGNTFIYFQF